MASTFDPFTRNLEIQFGAEMARLDGITSYASVRHDVCTDNLMIYLYWAKKHGAWPKTQRAHLSRAEMSVINPRDFIRQQYMIMRIEG